MGTESKPNNEFRLVLAESSQKDKVTVPLMSDVTVPCQLSPETSAVDMEIRWFKGTDCVCLYKEGHVIEGMGYKGRVGLLNKEIERGNVSLKLKNVSKSDDGVYLCQVTSGNRTKEKIVRLSLKTHEDAEMLQQTLTQLTEKTPQEPTDEKKMEKSAFIAVFSELKEAKQRLKEKDAQIKEPQRQINPMQTIEVAMEEDTQLENMTISENTEKELEPSKCQQDKLETKTTHLEKQQLNIEEVKVFTLFTGNTNILQKIQVDFIDTLRNRIKNLREVPTVDKSDVVLVFCPIVSQAGTDIDAAVKNFKDNTDSKPAVLVVLHHTFDPEKTVPDSSRCVNRTNMLTVDCLFYEDTGLLKCQKNSDAFDKAVNGLIQQEGKAGFKEHLVQSPGQMQQASQRSHKSKKDEEAESQSVEIKRQRKESYKCSKQEVKVFSILAGMTKNCDKKVIDILGKRIENLREVYTVDDSDVVLVFCPIVSRAGTDIEAALNKLNYPTDSKLTVLVVLHHTFDPEKTVPDSSRCVNMKDMLTVDCLYNEDTGLLECLKNSDALEKFVDWLIQQEGKAGFKVHLVQSPGQILAKASERSNQSKKDEAESHSVEIKSQNKESYKCSKQEVKVFSILAGKTNNCDKEVIENLGKRTENLREVYTVDDSDVVLVFCPIVSRAGTDIEAAQNNLNYSTDSKLTVLVVLHHTFDPEKTVPDSSRCVNRTNMLTVDCLYYEDTGLLKCQKNSDAFDKVVKWLIQQGVNICPPQKKWLGSFKRPSLSLGKNPEASGDKEVKVFSILAGKTNNCDKEVIDNLGKRTENLREVYTVDDSDVVLVFCPIVSRAGTEIDAALNKLNYSTDSKLTVLVVLHRTFDPEKTVPDSSRCVNRTNMLTVDCLYYEDKGLLKCQKNSDALDKVVKWLIQQGVNICPPQKKWLGSFKRPSLSLGKNPEASGDKEVKVFSILAGKTNNCDKEVIDNLGKRTENLREVYTVDDSDVVLVFCPIVSRAGTEIDAALNKLNYSTDSKLTVLVVLHHTFDPEKTVPDSSRCVNRTNMLIVDCLYYEDTGLLKCQKNSDAFDKVVKWLIQQGVNICPPQKKWLGSFKRPSLSLGKNPETSGDNQGQAVEWH